MPPRRRLLSAAFLVVAAAAVVTVVVAWRRPRPDLTEADAVRLARRSLTDAGLTVTAVSPHAVATTYRPSDGAPVDAWKTSAAVRGGRVEVWFYRDLGRAVFLEDRSPAGRPFVTDAQFERLGRFEEDVATHRWARKNVAATIAAFVIAVTAAAGATIVKEP